MSDYLDNIEKKIEKVCNKIPSLLSKLKEEEVGVKTFNLPDLSVDGGISLNGFGKIQYDIQVALDGCYILTSFDGHKFKEILVSGDFSEIIDKYQKEMSKKPWQMARKEFYSHFTGDDEFRNFNYEEDDFTWEQYEKYREAKKLAKIQASEVLPIYKKAKELGLSLNQVLYHYAIVKGAVKENLDVPDNVLEEYENFIKINKVKENYV